MDRSSSPPANTHGHPDTGARYSQAELEAELQARTAELRSQLEERHHAEEALRSQARLLELTRAVAVSANQAASVDEALQSCVDQVGALLGWAVGHAFVSAPGTQEMLSTSIWHLQDPARFQRLREATEQLSLGVGQGLPGRVCQT